MSYVIHPKCPLGYQICRWRLPTVLLSSMVFLGGRQQQCLQGHFFCDLIVQEWVTRVRVCNYVKIETGQNFPPVLKIVTRTAQAA